MFAGMSTFAQVKEVATDKEIMNSAKMIEVQSQKMKTDLGLSDNQATQIKALFTQQEQDREAIKAEVKALKASGQQLTDAERSGIKTKLDGRAAALDAQMKAILTPEQYAKWQATIAAQKAEFKKLVPKVG